MSQCQACTGRAELYLCPRCVAELRGMLRRIPEQLDTMAAEAVEWTPPSGVGQLEHGGRPSRTEPKTLAKYTDERLAHDELGYLAGTEGQRRLELDLERRRLTLAAVLSAGGVNASASLWRDKLQRILAAEIVAVCKSRGLATADVRAVPPSFIGPLRIGAVRCQRTDRAGFYALWLAQAVFWVACVDGAGKFHADIRRAVGRTDRIINGPEPTRYIGPCPAFDNDGNQCMQELRAASRDAAHIDCPQCGTRHEVRHVTDAYIARVGKVLLKLPRLGELLAEIDEPVKERTLQHWAKTGQLKPRGYWRPGGSRGIKQHSDKDTPGYWLDDARRLRDQKDRSKQTRGQIET